MPATKYLDFCNPSNVLDAIEAFERLAAIWRVEGTPGRLPVDQWDVLRRLVLKRDGYKCRICAASNTTLDAHHIIPVVNHGPNWPTNLITLCRKCHKKIHPHIEDRP